MPVQVQFTSTPHISVFSVEAEDKKDLKSLHHMALDYINYIPVCGEDKQRPLFQSVIISCLTVAYEDC